MEKVLMNNSFHFICSNQPIIPPISSLYLNPNSIHHSHHSQFPSILNKFLSNPIWVSQLFFFSTTNQPRMKTGESTAIDVAPETNNSGPIGKKKSTTPLLAAPVPVPDRGTHRMKRGLAIFDFVLRIGALASAVAAAAAMGTSGQTLPFFTQFFQFEASYDDLPTFQFFVVAMGIVAGYVVLSIPFSIVCIVRPHAAGPRVLLLILDAVALTVNTAAAGAAAAVVSLAHSGNSSTNWLSICNQFGDFCQQASGAVIGSFAAVLFFLLLILFSALSLKNTH